MPRSNGSSAQWPIENDTLFVELCHKFAVENSLLTHCFTSAMWEAICTSLNEKNSFQKVYTKKQCKDKYNRIKVSWRKYHKKMTQDTGLGIDNETGRITGIDSEQMSSNLEVI